MPQSATSSSGASIDLSVVWSQQDILGSIASQLSSNGRTLLRLVNKAAAAQFNNHRELHLSQPVATWAFSEHWAQPEACYNLNFIQREQLASSAAAFSSVANLQVVLAAELPPDVRHVQSWTGGHSNTAYSSCYGDPERRKYGVSWRELFLLGARHGSRAICEWCLQQCPDVPAWSKIEDKYGPEAVEARYNLVQSSYAFVAAACQAARSGHVDLLGWLLRGASRLAEAEAAAEAVGEAWGREEARVHLVPSALVGCDLPTVLQLWAWCGLDTAEDIPYRWACWGWRPVVEGALRSPHRDWRHKAEWAVGRATELGQLALGDGQRLFEAALEPFPGHTAEDREARLEWLKGQGSRPHASALEPAMAAGRLLALELLAANGLSPDRVIADRDRFGRVITSAAKAGRLGVLQELRARAAAAWGPEQWGAALRGAARGGRVSVLEWVGGCLTAEELRRLGRADDWVTSVFGYAARSGCVAAMAWALEHGCAADEHAWGDAVASGCEAAVDFLATLGCPQPMMGEPYEAVLYRGDWRLLPALHWAGISFGPLRSRLYATALSRSAPPEVRRWLEARAGADPRAGAETLEALRWCSYDDEREQRDAGEGPQGAEEVEDGAETDAEEEVERARRRHERGRWFGPAGLRRGGRGQAKAHRR